MTIKQLLNFALIMTLFSISQNNFAMKSGDEPELQPAKTRDLKKKESNRPKKRRKISEKREAEDIRKFESFDNLDVELKRIIFLRGLESIIHCNSIYGPLDGVKEYLNALYLTNKECGAIASELGWNNNLFGDNNEPLYKIIAIAWFVPKELIEQDSDVLNNELIPHFTRDLTDEQAPGFKKLPGERMRSIAACLIAGGSPNIKIGVYHVPLVVVMMKFLAHELIPLLFLKRVIIIDKEAYDEITTALIEAVPYPKILKMLLDYDYTEINFKNIEGDSALDMAVVERRMKSVKLLLEYGANADHALVILACRGTWDNDYKTDDETNNRMDAEIAKLLVIYGANIEEVDEFSHGIINEIWLNNLKKELDNPQSFNLFHKFQ